MANTIVVRVAPTGDRRFIYTDALAEVATSPVATVRRASHVEPVPGGWTADLAPAGGPVLGPFPLRATALAAEVAWLTAHVL